VLSISKLTILTIARTPTIVVVRSLETAANLGTPKGAQNDSDTHN
jgi:hypothetical protein